MFMNFQTESMAGTVEKSNAPAIAHFGLEPATGKKFLNRFVNRHSVNAGFNFLEREGLARFHRFPEFSLRFARAAAQHSTCHVAEVSGFPVAGENVEDDERICVERAVTSFVRVAGLIASGHD